MDETGIRFPGYLLDPSAQEFRPRYNNSSSSPEYQIPCLVQPQFYYPYPPPPPPPTSGFPLLPFYDGTAMATAYYNQIPSPSSSSSSSSSSMAYVSSPSSVPQHAPPPSTSPLPPLTTAATRVLLLSSVPGEVSEETVRRDMEVFGDVRAVQMERLIQDGIVTVHYYDLRSAEIAMVEIQEQHMQQQIRSRQHYNSLLMQNWGVENSEVWAPPPPPPAATADRGLISGRAVWAQFTVPMTAFMGSEGRNQGTIVVFNLDSGVSVDNFKQLFEAFGSVKEIRETPSKRNQRFVEFYDIRDAARALTEMDGKEIHGKRVIIEFSRPGGHKWMEKKLMINTTTSTTNHTKLLNPLPNTTSVLQAKNKSSKLCGNWNSWRSSVAANKDNNNGGVAEITDESNESVALSHQLVVVGSKKKKKKNSNNIIGKKSNSIINGDMNNYPSAATTTATAGHNKQQQQQQQAGAARSNSSNCSNRSSSSSSSWNNKKGSSSISSKQKNKGSMGSLGSQFLIDEGAIQESNCIKDTRTTVMIKNIPNKYSQKLLLNMLDNHCIHCNEQISDGEDQPLSSFDFLYLPIDFNNKCNVGYGFVNMTSPQGAWRLYKAFHLQPWEVFNSRKICQVTYARLQGLESLKEHFKNSKFACETEEYLLVVFSPPRDGKQQLTQPLPMGTGTGTGTGTSTGRSIIRNTATKFDHLLITRNHDTSTPTHNIDDDHSNAGDENEDGDYEEEDDGNCMGILEIDVKKVN